MSAKPNYTRTGDAAYGSMDKINPEFFAMTYGAFVVQLIKDYKDLNVVNAELFKIGYNMGIRLIDEFLAKSGIDQCKDFSDTAQVTAKIGLKMFLGVDADVTQYNAESKSFNITFKQNPLCDFVELPPGCERLTYSNVLCGAITGALRMVQLVVECEYVQDQLKGASEDEITVRLIEVLHEQYQEDE